MFVDKNSIAIVQIITQYDEVWCLIRIAAGEMNSILTGFDFVAEWSKNHGAIGMCICGRKGWKRVLQNRGFNEICINNSNKNNEKAGLHLLGKYYGISTKDDDPNHNDRTVGRG
ncbi:hypothetical protein AGRHK599_LOCUS1286 [Rhizobium rhizogenes]|uniref:Uncharacterized protein n=2 Tax=Rhizobiaceae TaxID=82115 RepID=A0AAN2A3V6_RHIRH|nr:hypothetical protein B0909_05245 [Rhizobium rhizogenes]OAM65837.1 hypothetical protein A8L48_22880 [Rhizobium rhizogenes]CAD0211259.1 hypothetical protein AGRHK599_LOCUS1286 [Rhizobium rhizogenes]